MPNAADSTQTPLALGANPIEQAIIDALSNGLRDGDEILSVVDASSSDFNTALTMLEINGIIAPLGANQWTLR